MNQGWRVVLFGAVVVAGVVVAAPPAAAATVPCTATWKKAAAGDVSEAAAWSTGAFPGAADVACIPARAHGDVMITSPFTVGALRAQGQKPLQIGAPLTLARADVESVVRTGVLTSTIGGAGRLLVGLGLGVPHDATIDVPLRNPIGTVHIAAGATLTAAGGLVGYDADADALRSGAFRVDGTLRAPQLRLAVNGGHLSVGPSGLLADLAGNDALPALEHNRGYLELRRTTSLRLFFTNVGTLVVDGEISLETPAFRQVRGTTLVRNGGFVRADDRIIRLEGGRLAGSGAFDGRVVGSGGELAPGDHVGLLTFTGGIAPAPRTVHIDVAGTEADHLSSGPSIDVTGSTLALHTVHGQVPAIGSSFTVLSSFPVIGTFSTVTGLDAAPDRYYDVAYTTNEVRLTVRPTPRLTVTNETITEPATGTAIMWHLVRLDRESTRPVTVTLRTGGITADSPADFIGRTETITFAPGQRTKFFDVTVNADAEPHEGEERYRVFFDSVRGATLGAIASGTILPPEG